MKLLPSGGKVVFSKWGWTMRMTPPVGWRGWLLFLPRSIYFTSLSLSFFLFLHLLKRFLLIQAWVLKGQTSVQDHIMRGYQESLWRSPRCWLWVYAWYGAWLLSWLGGRLTLTIYKATYSLWGLCTKGLGQELK